MNTVEQTAPANRFFELPTFDAIATAVIVPLLFVAVGHLVLLAGTGPNEWLSLLLLVAVIFPGLGLGFCSWAAGKIVRRRGGSSGVVHTTWVLAFGAYVFFALVWLFGVPFDSDFWLGGLAAGGGSGFD